MDNMAKYMNKNLKDSIESVQVVQGTAKDSGNVYYAVELNFINGYSKRLFLRSDEAFAWSNAFDQLETQIQINKEF